jgi:hypothetical protein
MSRKLQVKRGHAANLPTLAEGEFGFVTDEKKLYIGDGSNNLQLANADLSNVSGEDLKSKAEAAGIGGNKADDDKVVHKEGTENITGLKNFNVAAVDTLYVGGDDDVMLSGSLSENNSNVTILNVEATSTQGFAIRGINSVDFDTDVANKQYVDTYAAKVDLSNVTNENFKLKADAAGINDDFSNVVIIETSQDWVVPAGVRKIMVYLIGGGGGGCGGYNGNPSNPGGGGGGYYLYRWLKVIPGESYSIVIGTGGRGGSASTDPTTYVGKQGGTTSFGLISALGGSGGVGGEGGEGGKPGRVGAKGLDGDVCSFTIEAYGGSGGGYNYVAGAGHTVGGGGSARSKATGSGEAGTAGLCIIVY